MEIGWDDILQDESAKGIFNMELEDVDEAIDDELMDDGEVCLNDFSSVINW